MQKTPNYNLNKPEQTDVVNIEDLNANFDILDVEVAKKVNATDIPTSLPANGGNAATVNGKTVLENVPAGAKFTDTVYTHPNDANTRHVSDSEKANWNSKANGSHTHPASQVTAGTLPVGALATEGTDYTVRRLRNIYAGTSDLIAGSSALANGTFYVVYE